MTTNGDVAPAAKSVPSWRSSLDLVATLLMIAAAAAIILPAVRSHVGPTSPGSRELPPPAEPQSLIGAAQIGSAEAKIVVIEYSDFQCPYCGQFSRETLPGFERRYVETGKVRVAFRHFPLDKIHPFALQAAAATVCASQQGKFWEMQSALYRDQTRLDEASLRAAAQVLRLDARAFDSCTGDPATVGAVRADAAAGRALGVSATPTFLIGTALSDGRVHVQKVLRGAQTEAALGAAVESSAASVSGQQRK